MTTTKKKQICWTCPPCRCKLVSIYSLCVPRSKVNLVNINVFQSANSVNSRPICKWCRVVQIGVVIFQSLDVFIVFCFTNHSLFQIVYHKLVPLFSCCSLFQSKTDQLFVVIFLFNCKIRPYFCFTEAVFHCRTPCTFSLHLAAFYFLWLHHCVVDNSIFTLLFFLGRLSIFLGSGLYHTNSVHLAFCRRFFIQFAMNHVALCHDGTPLATHRNDTPGDSISKDCFVPQQAALESFLCLVFNQTVT